MEEVCKKLGELAALVGHHRDELDGLRASLKKHEELMDEQKNKNAEALAAQKKEVLDEIGCHDAIVMKKIDFCKEMVEGNKIAIDHQSERLVRAIKRIDQSIEDSFRQANSNMHE